MKPSQRNRNRFTEEVNELINSGGNYVQHTFTYSGCTFLILYTKLLSIAEESKSTLAHVDNTITHELVI